ncbi:uncharacterized protein [Panulirus ornatus]|uniref:uncharacterized protein n=1 Tax=Panulirus ornatus TaxID=150431 RepID=UPI003A888CE3
MATAMPSSSVGLLVSSVLLLWMVETREALNHPDKSGSLVDGSLSQVGRIVSQVVRYHHLAGCHLVLASTTTTDHTTIFPSILRHLSAGGQASKVVDVGLLFSQEEPTQDHLQHGLWHDARTTCRALILYVGAAFDEYTIKFLEASGLWLEPDTTTVVIGGRTAVTTIVHHAGLRNTIHLILLALDDVAPPIPSVQTLLRKGTVEKGNDASVQRRATASGHL